MERRRGGPGRVGPLVLVLVVLEEVGLLGLEPPEEEEAGDGGGEEDEYHPQRAHRLSLPSFPFPQITLSGQIPSFRCPARRGENGERRKRKRSRVVVVGGFLLDLV